MLVSFQDNFTFRARNNYLLSKSVSLSHGPKQLPLITNKAWRGVDFAPKNHQTRLSSAKFSFRDPTCTHRQRETTNEGTQSSTQTTKRRDLPKGTRQSVVPEDISLPKLSHKEQDFERKFRPIKPRHDAVSRAKEWRLIMMIEQYRNPQPFDHRGLDDAAEETQLRTLKTPDPYDIRFRTRGLTSAHKKRYTDALVDYGTRDIDFRFKTFKTPEPHYDNSLLHSKGRYSPAFSAYNAYLDRVNKTVSMD